MRPILGGPLGWMAFLASCFCLAAPLNGAESAQSAPNLQLLVRQTVSNEIQARQKPSHYYKYEDQETDLKGSQAFEVVQTPQGQVERLLAGWGP